MLLDQHQAFVVDLNLLLSTYNNFWNRDNLVKYQLCNHLLDQLQSFKCYHMFFNYFVLVDWKSFVHRSQHYSSLFLLVEGKTSCNLLDQYNFQMIKQNVYLLLENLDKLSNLNIGFVPLPLLLIDIYSS